MLWAYLRSWYGACGDRFGADPTTTPTSTNIYATIWMIKGLKTEDRWT